ncbi:MAG: hypothetical protein ACFE8A_03465 [Candidatus Hodarchaeota archaeon]
MTLAFLAFFLACIGIFLLVYIAFFFVSKKKFENFKAHLYIIIPLYCILCWAAYFVINGNFLLNYPVYDFTNYYTCGERVINNPSELYKHNIYNGRRYGYKYFPNFAVIVGVPLYLIPTMLLAYQIFFIINIFLGLVFTLLFNRILYLLNLKERLHRFLFLIVVSNGWLVLQLYANNQVKYLIGVILLFILRQEIQFRLGQIKKDTKYYLINYNLFIFAVGMFPYFLFFFLIYIFQDISLKELFERVNLKKYSIIIISFLIQNFLFIIYPELIFDYYEVVQRDIRRVDMGLNYFYLQFFNDYYFDSLSNNSKAIISSILNFILYGIVVILIIYRKLKLEEKFGILSLSIVFLNYVSYRIGLILFPLICLLFVPYLEKDIFFTDFIKKNKIILIGLLSVLGIYIIPNSDKYNYPYMKDITLTYLIFVIILGFCIFLLYRQLKFSKKSKSDIYLSNKNIHQ